MAVLIRSPAWSRRQQQSALEGGAIDGQVECMAPAPRQKINKACLMEGLVRQDLIRHATNGDRRNKTASAEVLKFALVEVHFHFQLIPASISGEHKTCPIKHHTSIFGTDGFERPWRREGMVKNDLSIGAHVESACLSDVLNFQADLERSRPSVVIINPAYRINPKMALNGGLDR